MRRSTVASVTRTVRVATDGSRMPECAMPVRTVVERGPKGKRAVAFSIDWPGWSRGAKTPELALATLEAYRDRYRPVANLSR